MRFLSTATSNGCPGAGTLANTDVSPIAGWFVFSLARAGAMPGLSPIVARATTGPILSQRIFFFIVCPPDPGPIQPAHFGRQQEHRRWGLENLWECFMRSRGCHLGWPATR